MPQLDASRSQSPALLPQERSGLRWEMQEHPAHAADVLDVIERASARGPRAASAQIVVDVETLREAMKLDRLKERIMHRRHNEGSAMPKRYRIGIISGSTAAMIGVCVGAAYAGGITAIVIPAVMPNLFVAGMFFFAKDYRFEPDPDLMTKRTLTGLGLLDAARSSEVYRVLAQNNVFDRYSHVQRVPSPEELQGLLHHVLGARSSLQLVKKIHYTLQEYSRPHASDRPSRRNSFMFRRQDSDIV